MRWMLDEEEKRKGREEKESRGIDIVVGGGKEGS